MVYLSRPDQGYSASATSRAQCSTHQTATSNGEGIQPATASEIARRNRNQASRGAENPERSAWPRPSLHNHSSEHESTQEPRQLERGHVLRRERLGARCLPSASAFSASLFRKPRR